MHPKRSSKIKKGWQFTKSSWAILRSEKELSVFSLFSFVLTFALLIPFLLFFGHNHAFSHRFAGQQYYTGRGLLAWIVLIIIITVLGNLFTSAILYGAMERFKGNDPTFKSSWHAVIKKLFPIVYFSLFMATIGLLLQFAEQRLPFVGKIFAWLANLGWAIANFFSLPVILFADHTVMPIDATKESADILRKVWGEGIVASTSLGIIYLLAMLVTVAVWTVVSIAGGMLKLGIAFFLPWGIIGGIAFLALIVVFSTLSGIIKAALYYYATTGKAPVAFDPETLHAAIVPRKKRRLLARQSV